MNLPPSISEADLLTIIEGGTLSADRRAVVEMALRTDPVLARTLRAMKADRAALTGLGDLPAPAHLLDDVQAVLERESLLTLADCTDPLASIPISQVQPTSAPIWQTALQSPWTRRLAVAASVALFAGVALLVLNSPRGAAKQLPGPNPGPIAQGAPEAPHTPAVASRNLSAPGAAQSETTAGNAAATESAAAPATAIAAAPASAPNVEQTTSAAAAAPDRLTVEQAALLALEGRLVVRITAASADLSGKSVEALRVRGGRFAFTDKLDVQSSTLVLAGLRQQHETIVAARRPAPPSPSESPTNRQPEPTVASNNPNAPSPAPPPAVPAAAGPLLPGDPPMPPTADTMYRVDCSPDQATLRSLIYTLSNEAQSAEFVALPRPLLMHNAAPLDTGAVLWWTTPPAGWTRRVTIPIVISPRPAPDR